MSTITKKFAFISDSEGWVPTSLGPSDMRWIPPANTNRWSGDRLTGILGTMGGCLKTTATNGDPQAENYWEWTGTWADLGVPVGNKVTSVTADYLYRWKCPVSRPTRQNIATFSATDTGSGPFELRTSVGTLIGTFSTRKNAIDRDAYTNNWRGYPSGAPTDALVEVPNSWATASGSSVSVPLINGTSSTIIKLRLRNLSPSTSPITGAGNAVRLKQDRVFLTITYVPLRKRFINS